MQSPAELSATRCRLKMQQPKLVEMERAKNECDCECECVCSYIFICGDGIKTIITNLETFLKYILLCIHFIETDSFVSLGLHKSLRIFCVFGRDKDPWSVLIADPHRRDYFIDIVWELN